MAATRASAEAMKTLRAAAAAADAVAAATLAVDEVGGWDGGEGREPIHVRHGRLCRDSNS